MVPSSSDSLLPWVLATCAVMMSTFIVVSHAQYASELTLDYYSKTCPRAQDIIRSEMAAAVRSNPRNAAAMIRMHFHDCFVQGCDASVLLDDTETFKGEKTANTNMNSLVGFELIDKIKTRLESECPGVVSCADILTVAARDATILAGGPYWDVSLGRKDSTTASLEGANSDIPLPNQGIATLMSKFLAKGLTTTDMVALSGAHTIGVARCKSFRSRLYGDYKYTSKNDAASAARLEELKLVCPSKGNDDNITALDYVTPTLFDNSYYVSLVKGKGLLNSDQELYSSILGFQTADLVKKYARDVLLFFTHFSDSMVRMSNMTNRKGGEVRKNCRVVNA